MELKIKLKIKDVEIELDKKELKELKNILDELFPKEKEYIYYPTYYPIYRTYPYWEVTYTTASNLTSGGNSSSYCTNGADATITYTGSSTI